MEIVIGTIADEKNKLNKTFNNQRTYRGNLRQEASITNPQIIIEAENLSLFNYMYIPQFGRYYYITDIVSIRNNLWSVFGKVDVLMSFKDGILSCPVVLSDSEITEQESYMSGDVWRSTVKTKTDIINFPSGLRDTGEYILITSGG